MDLIHSVDSGQLDAGASGSTRCLNCVKRIEGNIGNRFAFGWLVGWVG